MPLALDPNATVDFTFPHDRGKKDAAVFLLRHLSCRQVLEAEQILRAILQEKDAKKVNAMLDDILKMGLAGWRNIKRSFSIAAVNDVLTPREKGDLAYACIREPRLKEADLKNSGAGS